MKFLSPTIYIFVLLIYILLIKITIESEQKKLERIDNAINLFLSKANGKIMENISLTFEYEKYNITLKNFILLKPFGKNTSLIKEENNSSTNFFKKKDIIVAINADLYIQLFSQKDNEEMKYKSIFFEIFLNEIKFELINDFNLEYIFLDIESIKYNNLDNLDFFQDFNNKKKCKFYEGEKARIILENIDSKLKEIFKMELESKIKYNQKYFNLLTYDIINIFDNSYFNFTSNDDYNYISNLQITNMNIDIKNINLNLEDNSISIKYFSLNGIYSYEGIFDVFFNFTFVCQKDKEHFKFQRNKNNTKIEIMLSDCLMYDDNKMMETFQIEYLDEMIGILYTNYLIYEKKYADYYYNDIFN